MDIFSYNIEARPYGKRKGRDRMGWGGAEAEEGISTILENIECPISRTAAQAVDRHRDHQCHHQHHHRHHHHDCPHRGQRHHAQQIVHHDDNDDDDDNHVRSSSSGGPLKLVARLVHVPLAEFGDDANVRSRPSFTRKPPGLQSQGNSLKPPHRPCKRQTPSGRTPFPRAHAP